VRAPRVAMRVLDPQLSHGDRSILLSLICHRTNRYPLTH
jgi:hypothetical protein